MSGEIITIYIPIFREKLARLKALGRGNTSEAAGLRRTIARAENAAKPTADAKIQAAV